VVLCSRNGAGKKSVFQSHCEQVRAQIEETNSDYDKEKLLERLAKLAGDIAINRVGGSTEVDVKKRRDRVDAAIHATRAAVEKGIATGGDTTFLCAGEVLGGLNPQNDDRKAAINIVRCALEAPARQICVKAGAEGAIVVGKLLEKGDASYGLDVQAGAYADMINAGIIDPAKVVRLALHGGGSIAGLMISTEAMVAQTAGTSRR